MALLSGSMEGLNDWLAVDAGDSDSNVVLEFTELSLDDDKQKSDKKEKKPLLKRSAPLQSRHVEAYVNLDAGLSETTETLRFGHPKKDCSANFRFPLPPNAAVNRFEATVAGKVITTVVKDKAEAQKEYNEALYQGHTAVQMSQQSKQNIYQVSLGNLPANQEAEIKITYIRMLQQTGNAIEYIHTATWVPPYYSWHDGRYQDARPENQPRQENKTVYPLTYSVRLQDSKDLKKDSAHSSTHAVLQDQSDSTGLTYTVFEEVSDPSKDFQLAVEVREKNGSQIQMQTTAVKSGNELSVNTILASFAPESKTESKTKRQIMLVIDGSGSMSGSAIDQARESAELFIRDLPLEADIYFNIMMFGSSYQYMWSEYQAYNKQTQQRALNWLQQRCDAHYGGTELLAAMRSVYKTPLKHGYTRSILLLTDGGVNYGQDEQLTKLVTPTSWDTHMTHVFTLGIGSGVHRPLLDAVATKSHGVSQYVMGSTEIAEKMGRLSEAAQAENCVYEPKLKCRGCMLDIVPTRLPNVIYPGYPLTLLARVTKANAGASLELICKDGKGVEQGYNLPLPTSATCQGSSFKTLHAMSKISELLNGTSMLHIMPNGESKKAQPSGKEVKAEVVNLAIAENLVTQHTSSVGVELRHDPLDPYKVKHHEIAIQAPSSGAPPRVFRDRGERFVQGYAMPQSAGMYASVSKGASVSMGIPRSAGAVAKGGYDGCPPPAMAAPGSGYGGGGFRGASYAPQGYDSSEEECEEACDEMCDDIFGDECVMDADDEDMGCSLFENAVDEEEEESEEETEFARAPPTPAATKPLQGPELVQALSKLRTIEGYWQPTDALYNLIFSRRANVSDMAAEFKKVSASSESDVSATILVLAFLSKYSQKEKPIWQGMWQKAVKLLENKVDTKEPSVERRVMSARAHV